MRVFRVYVWRASTEMRLERSDRSNTSKMSCLLTHRGAIGELEGGWLVYIGYRSTH